jgi:hypothetical protein
VVAVVVEGGMDSGWAVECGAGEGSCAGWASEVVDGPAGMMGVEPAACSVSSVLVVEGEVVGSGGPMLACERPQTWTSKGRRGRCMLQQR